MEHLTAGRRTTHKYVGSYRHLDAWVHVGTVRHTPFRKVYDPRRDENAGLESGPTFVAFARLPAGADMTLWRAAIEDSLSSHGCAHEHDCCGCPSHHARVRPYRGRVVRIILGVSYNY
jgi:hypothetical protein